MRKIALYRSLSTVSVDEVVSSVAKALTPKARVLALTWLHSSTGLKLPISEIAEAVEHANRNRDGGLGTRAAASRHSCLLHARR